MDEGRQVCRAVAAILLNRTIKSAVAAWREKGYELSASVWPLAADCWQLNACYDSAALRSFQPMVK
jgi:hypothetical protein